MKNATKHAKALTTLLKKLPAGEPAEFPDADDAVAVLVQSLLLENTTAARAHTAYGRLTSDIVDFNDLRVSMPHEMVERIGVRYPQATDRCQRIRSTLRDIFLKEHDVTLERLKSAGKRDVKKFVDDLDGISPYAAARLLLLAFDAHAIPVDEQLRKRLVDAGAIDEDATVAEVGAWLSRQVKASDGVATHLAFQVWVDSPAKTTRTRKPAARGAKKTTKKTTAKTPRKTGGRKRAADSA
ncbi:MAG: hypothetical protein HKO59_12340 [Phycisphaerales bacterium]|nr:hypothetical protein [Phycisphaerales bacterium]NNM26751.1 hypothetical protein [Phycisphaerales bacterium]